MKTAMATTQEGAAFMGAWTLGCKEDYFRYWPRAYLIRFSIFCVRSEYVMSISTFQELFVSNPIFLDFCGCSTRLFRARMI